MHGAARVLYVGRVVRSKDLPTLLRVLRVPVGLGDERLDGVPAPESGPRLPIRGEHPVPLLEGHRAADLARLLPRAGHVEPDPALALKGEHPVVERANEHEVAVRPLQQIGCDIGLELRIVRAIGVDDPEKSLFCRPLTPPEPACVPE